VSSDFYLLASNGSRRRTTDGIGRQVEQLFIILITADVAMECESVILAVSLLHLKLLLPALETRKSKISNL
jgi:hypothetical protein